jgi:hypothetical protein
MSQENVEKVRAFNEASGFPVLSQAEALEAAGGPA